MSNEGAIIETPKIVIKSEMIRQLQRLAQTTPDEWERATFQALVRKQREEIDWSVEDNQAGYYTWIRSFDQLVGELVDDGYVRVEQRGQGGERVLVATDAGASP